MRISTRLLLIVATCLLPIIALSLLISWQQWSDRKSQLGVLAVQQAQLLAGDVHSMARGAQILLGAATQFREVQQLDDDCSARLEGLVRQAPGFAFMALVDRDGHLRCASHAALLSGLADPAWASEAREAETFVAGRFARSSLVPGGFLPFYKPIEGSQPASGGRLVAALELQWLEAHLRSLKHTGSPFLANGVLTLADVDGVVLARDVRHAEFVGRQFPAEALGAMRAEQPGILRLLSLDGTFRLVGYSPPTPANYNLAALVGFSETDLMGAMALALRRGALLLGLACLVAVGATLLVARQFIAKPTRSLLAVARRWQEGDLDARAPASTGSEFGQVGAAFNEMAKAVQRREDLLRAQAGVLEDRVAQRTRELVAARDRLQAEVAERRGTEAALLQAQKVQAVGQLAGGIAHDFNNVLQAVLGGVALIRRRAGDEAKVRHLAGMVEDAARRGESVTRRLLAFSRREELRATVLDLGGVLDGLREVLVATLGTRIQVVVRVSEGLPCVLADRGQLETALVNLATNARDAMPAGGVLTLSAEAGVTRPGCLPPGDYIRVSVADDGEGMAQETLARATEPFFTTKPRGQGTGLGLAMARSFAQGSGGALVIDSAQGSGTCVSLWLPVAAAQRPAPLVPDPPRPRPRGGDRRGPPRLLLVDDDDAVRRVVAAELEDAGFSVSHCANGAAALVVLETDGPFDALISDLAMPGLDGVTVIREAQRRVPGLPAILITGYVDDVTALAAAAPAGGGFRLLRKPIAGTALAEEVALILRTAPSPVPGAAGWQCRADRARSTEARPAEAG